MERITSGAIWAKVLRIVLVFALVFWGTFRIEAFAFAALRADDGAGHEPGTLTDIDVWEVNKADASRVAVFVRDARDTATGNVQSADIRLSSLGEQTQFVALPAWGESTSADTSGDIVVADFVDWSISDGNVASLQANGGVATLVGHSPGSATVTCKLRGAAANLLSPSYSGSYGPNLEVSFTVTVVAPYVSSLELHQPDGTICYDNQELVLTDANRAGYALTARVNAFNESTGESYGYDITPGQSLSAVSGGAFGDLVWQVLNSDGSEADPAVATVDNGLVNLVGDGPVIVRCLSPDGLNGSPLSAQVVVMSDKAKPDPGPTPEDPQGADYHQDSLTITINAPSPEKPSDDQAGNGENSGSAQSPDASDEALSPQEGSSNAAASNEAASGSSASSSADDETASTVKSGVHTYSLADLEAALDFGTETYTMPVGDSFKIVTGQGPSLAALLDYVGISVDQQTSIESIEFITSGAGGSSVTVDWSDLVSANVFYPHAATGDRSDYSRSVTMLAARSYVHGADEPADAAISSDKLLDNTRFRLLYGAGGGNTMASPDAFRWISGIVINMEGANGHSGKPEVDPGDDPQVFVDYVAVPRGETAILSPRYYLPPSISGGSVQFGYTWEMSKDGAVWETVRDSATGASEGDSAAASGQALHVLTDDNTIGTYRRFVLHISQYDGKTGEEVQSTIHSAPVRIRAAGEKLEGEDDVVDEGYVIALDYIPPIAGDVANFTAVPTITKKGTEEGIDASAIDYEWQMSTDGGLSWVGRDDPSCPSLLKQQSGVMCKTLRIPTQPIDDTKKPEADESSSEEETQSQLIYIRVVAHYAGHRPVASNAQPLTVHVGETEGGQKADDIEDAINDNSSQSSEKSSSAASPSATDPSTDTPQPQPNITPRPQLQVTEIDSVVFEDPTVSPVETPEATQPTVEPQAAPSQIYVNSEISELVVEQKQAQDESVAAAPGYKWTQLSTINPSDDDVKAILGVNPFAPLAVPFALGLTAAGAVEKVVVFRRQKK